MLTVGIPLLCAISVVSFSVIDHSPCSTKWAYARPDWWWACCILLLRGWTEFFSNLHDDLYHWHSMMAVLAVSASCCM